MNEFNFVKFADCIPETLLKFNFTDEVFLDISHIFITPICRNAYGRIPLRLQAIIK